MKPRQTHSTSQKKPGLLLHSRFPIGKYFFAFRGSAPNSYFYNPYRFLNAEEQGLSTNLRKDSAQFMNVCKMHRLSLKHFLQRFPFGEDSELIADGRGWLTELRPGV